MGGVLGGGCQVEGLWMGRVGFWMDGVLDGRVLDRSIPDGGVLDRLRWGGVLDGGLWVGGSRWGGC